MQLAASLNHNLPLKMKCLSTELTLSRISFCPPPPPPPPPTHNYMITHLDCSLSHVPPMLCGTYIAWHPWVTLTLCDTHFVRPDVMSPMLCDTCVVWHLCCVTPVLCDTYVVWHLCCVTMPKLCDLCCDLCCVTLKLCDTFVCDTPVVWHAELMQHKGNAINRINS